MAWSAAAVPTGSSAASLAARARVNAAYAGSSLPWTRSPSPICRAIAAARSRLARRGGSASAGWNLHPSRVRVAISRWMAAISAITVAALALLSSFSKIRRLRETRITRAREIALRLADEAELVQGVGHAARLAERLAQREAPLVQLQRAAVVALKPVHGAESVEGRGGAAAVAAPLANGQRAFQMRDRAVVVADRPADEAGHVVGLRDAGFVAERLRRGARSRQEVAGRDEVASSSVHRSKVHQGGGDPALQLELLAQSQRELDSSMARSSSPRWLWMLAIPFALAAIQPLWPMASLRANAWR